MTIIDLAQLPDDELEALVTLLQLELAQRSYKARVMWAAMRAQENHDRLQAEKDQTTP